MHQPMIIAQLNTLSDSYKSQFSSGVTLPPLVWQMDKYGDLWLDNLNLGRCAPFNCDGQTFSKKGMFLPTSFGSLEIIIEWPVKNIAMITELVIHKKVFTF